MPFKKQGKGARKTICYAKPSIKKCPEIVAKLLGL